MQMPHLAVGVDVQSAWSFEDPIVSFTTPSVHSTPRVNVSFDISTRTLAIAVLAMDQEALHVLSITGVRTPSSVVSANNVTVTTLDSRHRNIDRSLSMVTNEIVVGALESASFDTGTDTPGFLDTATVTFRTAGRVQAGGKVLLQLPDLGFSKHVQLGWRFEASLVLFQTLFGNVTLPAVVSESRAIVFDVNCFNAVEQHGTYRFMVTNVRTPSSVVCASRSAHAIIH